MRETTLSSKVWRGLGKAARATGENTDAYRPADGDDPLRLSNRFLRLPAVFHRPPVRMVRPGGYGEALWEGLFDARYTRAGDYLVRPDGATWFVAAQSPAQVPLCVRTLRRLSFWRPSGPVAAGSNSYGGVAQGSAPSVLTGWPAAVVTTGVTGPAALATTAALKQVEWAVLLPPLDWLALMPGDTMTDDLARTGVVQAAEFTQLGWRLAVRQSTS
jgi:hypothetical protein